MRRVRNGGRGVKKVEAKQCRRKVRNTDHSKELTHLLFNFFSSAVLQQVFHFLYTSHVSCVPSPTKNPEFFHVSTLSVGSV